MLLIVEDDTELRTQMKWGLGRDYQVLLAEDRLGAIEMFRSERPLVVTLDLGLPPQPAGVEEGFLTLAEILEQEQLSKVIVITGQIEKQHALSVIGNGAYDFLAKPVDLQELQASCARLWYSDGSYGYTRIIKVFMENSSQVKPPDFPAVF